MGNCASSPQRRVPAANVAEGNKRSTTNNKLICVLRESTTELPLPVNAFKLDGSPEPSTGDELTLTEFTIFEKLPAEIRIKIWKASIASRLVRVRSIDDNRRRRKFVSSTPVPAILHVCSESRYEGLKVYKLCFEHPFEMRSHSGNYRPPMSAATIYFSYAHDTLLLKPRSRPSAYPNLNHYSSRTADWLYTKELENVQSIAIERTPSFSSSIPRKFTYDEMRNELRNSSHQLESRSRVADFLYLGISMRSLKEYVVLVGSRSRDWEAHLTKSENYSTRDLLALFRQVIESRENDDDARMCVADLAEKLVMAVEEDGRLLKSPFEKANLVELTEGRCPPPFRCG